MSFQPSLFYQVAPFRPVQCRICTMYLNTREEMKFHNLQHASESFQCNRPRCKMMVTQETSTQHNAEFHANQPMPKFHNREYPVQISSDIHQQIMFLTQEGDQNMNKAQEYDALSIKLRNKGQVCYEKASVLQKQMNCYQPHRTDLRESYQTMQQPGKSNSNMHPQARHSDPRDITLPQQSLPPHTSIDQRGSGKTDPMQSTRHMDFPYENSHRSGNAYNDTPQYSHGYSHLSSDQELQTMYYTMQASQISASTKTSSASTKTSSASTKTSSASTKTSSVYASSSASNTDTQTSSASDKDTKMKNQESRREPLTNYCTTHVPLANTSTKTCNSTPSLLFASIPPKYCSITSTSAPK
jgi:hypothetical protein